MKALLLLTMLGALVCPTNMSSLELPRSCPGPMPGLPCSDFWRYDTIFVGTVKKLVNVPFADERHAYWQKYEKVTATLSVGETFRGKLEAEVTFEMGDCYFEFIEGEKYLIYTNKRQGSKFGLGKNSSPSKLLSQAGADLDFLRSLPDLPPGGRVFGTVYDHRASTTLRIDDSADRHDKTIPGVNIYLRNSEKSYQTISDATGFYEFTRVPAGTYQLSTDLPGFLSGTRHEVLVVDKACGDASFSIQATGIIEGRLVGPNGEPIENAVVSIFLADGVSDEMFDRVKVHYVTRHNTTKDGKFSFQRLRSGRYHLAVNLVAEEKMQESGTARYPRMFYPGTATFKDAKTITITDGAKLDTIEFKLPALKAEAAPSPTP